MSNLTNYFNGTIAKDGIASIIRDSFNLKLNPELMDQVTNIVINKLDSAPSITEGEDKEVDMFYYLLYTMLQNITLQAKVTDLEETVS
jgi:hypothetical protein